MFGAARTRLKEEDHAAQKQRNNHEVGEQSDATRAVNVVNLPSQLAIDFDAWPRKDSAFNKQNTPKRTFCLSEAQQRNFKSAY